MKTYSIKEQLVIVRAESADTNGICALLEMHHPANSGPPLHVHKNEDEGFYILEGQYRFQLGDKQREAGPGDFLIAPRKVPHCFKCLGPETGKMLVSFMPGGAEEYFEKLSQISEDDPERTKKSRQFNEEYGVTILGKGL